MSILIDTGAWYALADTADRHHGEARRFYTDRVRHAAFVTTDAILAETWALIRAHLGRPAAVAFWQGLRDAQIPVIAAEPADLEGAWRIVQSFPNQPFSLVDSTTFAIMERLGISEAFAFDAQFLVYRYGSGRQRSFTRYP